MTIEDAEEAVEADVILVDPQEVGTVVLVNQILSRKWKPRTRREPPVKMPKPKCSKVKILA